jgi:hypothetical protein
MAMAGIAALEKKINLTIFPEKNPCIGLLGLGNTSRMAIVAIAAPKTKNKNHYFERNKIPE